MKPTRRDAYRLMHEGVLALAGVEENGIRVDVEQLDRTIEKTEKQIDRLTERLKESEEWDAWLRLFGRSKASMGSRVQLAAVLESSGHVLTERTAGGKRKSMAKGVLERLDDPFVKLFIEIEELKIFHRTFLKGVKRELEGCWLHCFYNLHTVRTYRSSSDRINFQNIPIRDKVMGRLIRSCFVPRDGHALVELDFKQIEVRVAACHNRDPVLIEYIRTGHDFHRDFAARCYMIERSEVGEDARYAAKNRFVFPTFYGSYFMKTASSLWEAIGELRLNVDGVSLKENLRDRGITGLGGSGSHWRRGRTEGETGRIETTPGTFVDHVREVEEDLWRRFEVYAQWKRDWYAAYLKRGWFDLLTGFRETGVYKRNDVINHPIQGAAFHILLLSLILLMKEMKKKKMRSKVVGQIHDSVLADVHLSELDDYVATVRRLMTEDIRKAWSWIVVPLDVDVAVAEKNWFEKREMEKNV